MKMPLWLGRCPSRVTRSMSRRTESFMKGGARSHVEWSVFSHRRVPFLTVAVLPFAVACDDPTQPIDRPRVTEINTVAIEATDRKSVV